MKLTVDKNGKDATERRSSIPTTSSSGASTSQYMDNYNARAETALFGAGSLARQPTARPRSSRTTSRRRREVVQRRRLEGPLHPDRQPGRERPARRGQRVRLGQPRDRRGPHVVHLLRRRRRRPKKPFKFGFAVQPTVNGKITLAAPRGHVQHPQDDQGSGRGVQGPDRHDRVARAADRLRRHAGRRDQAGGVVSTRSTPSFPGINLDWDVGQGDARLPRHPQPPVLVRTTRRSAARCRPSGTTTGPPRARHGRRARKAPGDPPGHLRRRDP